MKRVAAADGMLKGYDVYHGNDTSVHQKQKAAGSKFCFIKATEGLRFKDPVYNAHYDEAKTAGMIVGAYHFLKQQGDPIAQAEFFARNSHSDLDDLGPVLDWESDGIEVDYALAFLKRIEELTKKRAIVYGSPYFLSEFKLSAEWKARPLWIANFGNAWPLVPAPWDSWTFWQYLDDGVDFNKFNGSLDDLKSLAKPLV